jgi:hypothetical protein
MARDVALGEGSVARAGEARRRVNDGRAKGSPTLTSRPYLPLTASSADIRRAPG